MTQPPTTTMAPATPQNTTTATAYFFNGTTDGGAPSITFNKTSNLLPRISKTITVHSFRHRSPPASIATTRCELVPAPTKLVEAALKSPDQTLKQSAIHSYYAECELLVQSRVPGCVRALAFHHRHREQAGSSSKDLHGVQSFANKPVATFHVDNDSTTAELHLRRKVGDVLAEKDWLGEGKRWGIVNVWRPVGDIAYRLPLALAVQDESSSSSSPLSGKEEEEETMVRIKTPQNYKTHFIGVRPLSEQKYKFWYASNMTPDEALIFMDYDSANGEISGVAHGAVEDHNTPEGAPLRRSIEVRVLVLYED